ncbi:methyltransferase domain-containing protein [Rubrobacter tropicus]|uniref:Methyltransferase domain-containing protein n=1 Tax=Rubrobacter tropicus TaxID=2653851 RepID=A0A6G8Q7A3_9ACTN|nr:class I SAM-dependent methyltransferase [Rubrobacter tropicus]QIN82319.1 methyltransferase domain-containing protein [Rubrobacter tropicus]
MNHEEVGRYWDENAEAWTELVRAGYDHYRDGLNTPAFLQMLPDVAGLSGLDVGCGEGHNTRLLAGRGAQMTGIDISETFIRHAAEAEEDEPLGIRYERASAVKLPFKDETFDFATAFMSLMDIPETDLVLAEVFRVLKPGGFFQFSIEHPCFATPHSRTLRDERGRAYAREVGRYFQRSNGEAQEWTFSAAPPEVRERTRPFRVPRFTRTLGEWLNLLVEAGFVLDRFGEPYPTDAAVRERPRLQNAQVFALFLHVRASKPA